VLQFACDVVKDAGKEEYLRPFIRIRFRFCRNYSPCDKYSLCDHCDVVCCFVICVIRRQYTMKTRFTTIDIKAAVFELSEK